MNELKSIGTIISYYESTFMIVGFETCVIASELVPHYIIVPVPLGYINQESLRAIPVDSEFEVVQEGFINELGEKYLAGRLYQFNEQSRLSAEQWESLEPVFISSMESAGGQV